MITHLRLMNYRSLGNAASTLEPITLFVGPVGAGKSNILRALVAIQNSIHYSLVEMFPPGLGEFQWVRSRWACETDPIGFEVDLHDIEGYPDTDARYTLKLADAPEGLYVLEETLQRRSPGQDWDWVFQRRMRGRAAMGEFGAVEARDPTILHKVWHRGDDVVADAPGPKFSRATARALSRIGYYHLEVSELKGLGTGQPWDRIAYYGGRLPDFIAWAKSTEEGAPVYAAILQEMRELLPDLETIIVTRVGTDRQGLAMSFRNQRGYIAAPDLSDGTMLTLGLLCILHGLKKPELLCLEEPEDGLHPRRLRWIVDRLVGLAYPPPGVRPVQVLLTTHSPSLVDLFYELPRSILVVEQRQGRTQIVPLTSIRDQLRIAKDNGAIGREWATGLYEGL